MAYGLIGYGDQFRKEASTGFQQVAAAEQNRNMFNQQLDQANRAAKMQAVGTGAGIGASIAASNIAAAGGLSAAGGMAALGPIGWGALAGYAMMELF
jgi:hypothetical protein